MNTSATRLSLSKLSPGPSASWQLLLRLAGNRCSRGRSSPSAHVGSLQGNGCMSWRLRRQNDENKNSRMIHCGLFVFFFGMYQFHKENDGGEDEH